MYRHFVITRFNLPSFPNDKNGRLTLTDSWMEERFLLFEKYCIPSIKNQSTNFEWLVLFDTHTDHKYREKISKYENEMSFFRSIYTDDLTKIKDYIADRLTESDKWLITTRIDNDDAIHKDFLRNVQSALDYKKKDYYLRYNYGYQWDSGCDVHYSFSANANIDDVYEFTFSRFMNTLCLYLADRLGMGNSIEIRSPLIDYKLVEFVSSLPLDFKYKINQPKYFLKETLRGIVPDYILYAEKRGFTPPFEFIHQMNKQYRHKLIQSDFVFYNSMLADTLLYKLL